MTAHEAKVEVLTAEVRVLKVGSRQITLSVYAQLDTVDDSDIEPFGRVRARADQDGYVYVIGRDKATGTLVKAMRPSVTDSIRARIMTEAADARQVCLAVFRLSRNDHYYERPMDEDMVRRHADAARWTDRRVTELHAAASEWGLLPLIVLAGLR